MSTTSLFVELLVGGIQSLTWLFILTATCFDLRGIWDHIGDLSAALTISGGVFVLSIAYVLGVLFDRLWDGFLEAYLPDLKQIAKDQARKERSSVNDEFGEVRSKLYRADGEHAATFVAYSRSRMRVARASVFNIPLITICCYLFVLVRCEINKGWLLLAVAIVGGLLSLLASFAYGRLQNAYYQNLLMIRPMESTHNREEQ